MEVGRIRDGGRKEWGWWQEGMGMETGRRL